MIPVGNWEETNDELRNDIADLEEELNDVRRDNELLDTDNTRLAEENHDLVSLLHVADTDIADYLFELDHIHTENVELTQDVEGLLLLVEHWQEKAAEAEMQLEVMTGAKTFWMKSANQSTDAYLKADDELTELKAALRTLGGEKEN